MTLNMAVLAPIPRARERQAAAVTPGFLRRIRHPKRRSSNMSFSLRLAGRRRGWKKVLEHPDLDPGAEIACIESDPLSVGVDLRKGSALARESRAFGLSAAGRN